MPNSIQSQIAQAEEMGLIADSMMVRKKLMENREHGFLQKAQDELKKIQNDAHKNGLLLRSDFNKDNFIDLNKALERKKQIEAENLKKELEKKLIVKQESKKSKI